MSGRKLALILLLALYLPLHASSSETSLPSDPDKIHLARLEYTGIRDYTSPKGWYTDYPSMEENCIQLVNRLTGVRSAPAKTAITNDIFNYPLLYIVEPEQMALSDKDVSTLQEYFARGGFVIFDDFHGDEDFGPVKEIVARLFPNRDRLWSLPVAHPIFHIFYDIEEIVQTVNDGIALCGECIPWENGPSGRDPAVFAHYTDFGSINAVFFYNNDLGDGCEWLDDPKYPRQMAGFSVRMLTNTIIWGLTH